MDKDELMQHIVPTSVRVCVCVDRNVPDGSVLQGSQQAVLRGGRKLQVCPPLPAQSAGRAG